jgi:hypothetical protein
MKLACVIPWMSPFLWAKPIPSFLNLKIPKGVEVRWFMPNGWCSARRKTGGVEQAMEWGADYIWFVDADQLCEEDTLELLWAHVEAGRVPICALQPARGHFPGLTERPYQPVAWDEEGKPFTPTEVRQIVYGPLNCILLDMKTFRDMKRPWFNERFNPTTMARLSSIDQHFTARLANEIKTPVWVDPTIRPKHMEAFPLDWEFQDRFSEPTHA